MDDITEIAPLDAFPRNSRQLGTEDHLRSHLLTFKYRQTEVDTGTFIILHVLCCVTPTSSSSAQQLRIYCQVIYTEILNIVKFIDICKNL